MPRVDDDASSAGHLLSRVAKGTHGKHNATNVLLPQSFKAFGTVTGHGTTHLLHVSSVTLV
jgi:hypothetical protein